jgi:hypothetical protein
MADNRRHTVAGEAQCALHKRRFLPSEAAYIGPNNAINLKLNKVLDNSVLWALWS